MVFLLTCKNEDPIKNEGAKSGHVIHLFFRCSRAANSVVGGEMWQKFKLIETFMVVLVTCKNDEQFENEGTRVVTTFLPL